MSGLLLVFAILEKADDSLMLGSFVRTMRCRQRLLGRTSCLTLPLRARARPMWALPHAPAAFHASCLTLGTQFHDRSHTELKTARISMLHMRRCGRRVFSFRPDGVSLGCSHVELWPHDAVQHSHVSAKHSYSPGRMA